MDNIIIYKITNIINKKVYIGKSLTKYRWKKHLWYLKMGTHINKHLQSSFNKYGIESFTFEIIEFCKKNDLSRREIYWIKKYKSTDPSLGYNKTKGGDGLNATQEIKDKISKKLSGVPHTEERRKNESLSHLGYKFTKKQNKKKSKSIRVYYKNNPDAGKNRNYKSRKIVLQYNLNMILINEWPSTGEIQRQLKIDRGSISKCCNGKVKTAGGFIWKYKKNNNKIF